MSVGASTLIFWYESREKREGERMVDIMQGSFLTRAEGDDSKLVWVKYNSGTSKPMRHAKKRCLDDAQKWARSLHRFPAEAEWRNNPKMFTLETVEELFGSFDEMLAQLRYRSKPPGLFHGTPKGTTSQGSGKDANIQTETSDVKPKSQKSKEASTMKRREWTDQELANCLHQACGDQDYVTTGQYEAWKELAAQDGMTLPDRSTIMFRLGDGKWRSAFPKMREILGIREPESDGVESKQRDAPRRSDEQCLKDVRTIAAQVDTPLSQKQYKLRREQGMLDPRTLCDRFGGSWADVIEAAGLEPSAGAKKARDKVRDKTQKNDEVTNKLNKELLGSCSYRLVNVLGYAFEINGIHFESTYDDWRAVIEKTERITAQSEILMAQHLKLTQDITGQSIDFPDPQEGVFYLVDAKLFQRMNLSCCQLDRHDLIPVYHDGNVVCSTDPDSGPTSIETGFYVSRG